jgi:hypothetical protein
MGLGRRRLTRSDDGRFCLMTVISLRLLSMLNLIHRASLGSRWSLTHLTSVVWKASMTASLCLPQVSSASARDTNPTTSSLFTLRLPLWIVNQQTTIRVTSRCLIPLDGRYLSRCLVMTCGAIRLWMSLVSWLAVQARHARRRRIARTLPRSFSARSRR